MLPVWLNWRFGCYSAHVDRVCRFLVRAHYCLCQCCFCCVVVGGSKFLGCSKWALARLRRHITHQRSLLGNERKAVNTDMLLFTYAQTSENIRANGEQQLSHGCDIYIQQCPYWRKSIGSTLVRERLILECIRRYPWSGRWKSAAWKETWSKAWQCLSHQSNCEMTWRTFKATWRPGSWWAGGWVDLVSARAAMTANTDEE